MLYAERATGRLDAIQTAHFLSLSDMMHEKIRSTNCVFFREENNHVMCVLDFHFIRTTLPVLHVDASLFTLERRLTGRKPCVLAGFGGCLFGERFCL